MENYYETGMEYHGLLESMKDEDLDNLKWYDDIISIPDHEIAEEKIISGRTWVRIPFDGSWIWQPKDGWTQEERDIAQKFVDDLNIEWD